MRHLDGDGGPVATGIVAIGDASACTNPSVGRGASIGLLQADVPARCPAHRGPGRSGRAGRSWYETTGSVVTPFVRDTLDFDRHRLAEIDAQIAGVPYETDDPGWNLGQKLRAGAASDPDLLRGDERDVGARPRCRRVQPGRRSSTRCSRSSRRVACPARTVVSCSTSSAPRPRRRMHAHRRERDRARRGGQGERTAGASVARLARLPPALAPSGRGPDRGRLPHDRARPARLRRLRSARRCRGVLAPQHRRRRARDPRPPRHRAGPRRRP